MYLGTAGLYMVVLLILSALNIDFALEIRTTKLWAN